MGSRIQNPKGPSTQLSHTYQKSVLEVGFGVEGLGIMVQDLGVATITAPRPPLLRSLHVDVYPTALDSNS